jgi:hypothetical protein
VVRELTPEQIAGLQGSAEHYVHQQQRFTPASASASPDRPAWINCTSSCSKACPCAACWCGWRQLARPAGAAAPAASDGGHAFPAPVRTLLGEMAAASVLMQGSLKFNGALILQMQGDGPVKLAVAEAQPDLSFRVTAKVVGDVPADARLEAMLNVHGQGRCAITLDPQDRLPGQQPYQGVVPLHGDRREPLQNLSEVLEHYMLQSEQLDTRLVLAANDDVAAGLLIQRLPMAGEVPTWPARCWSAPTKTRSAAARTTTASPCWPAR